MVARCLLSSYNFRNKFCYFAISAFPYGQYFHRSHSFHVKAGHVPVLLDEIIKTFKLRKLKVFVDGTVGLGGHATAIIKSHPELQTIVGFDLDPAAHKISSLRIRNAINCLNMDTKYVSVMKNYSSITSFLYLHEKVDGIMLDLGVSSMQLQQGQRGFSFITNGSLDMRMGVETKTTAFDIVNAYDETSLGRIFREYGEVKCWKMLANRVVKARQYKAIESTFDLVEALGYISSKNVRKKIHPATKVFQALRIEVNQELRHLELAIPQCIEMLSPGGALAIISFHSLEDRIVKKSFKAASIQCSKRTAKGIVLTKKPIQATKEELVRNPRCRSAKLRIFQKTL